MRRVGIVGFRGYSGAELLDLLWTHPGVEPVLLEHRSEAEARPVPRGTAATETIKLERGAIQDANLTAVMLATPHEVSLELTPMLLELGLLVVDLSAAYRLRDADTHARWYKHTHPQPELLQSAIYGLPEFYRDRIPGAKLLANPGCYPTAANLAIRPLLKAGLLEEGAGVVCDAKSGVSGAGRKPTLKTHFCEVTENFSAYAVLEHRHVPEVLQNSGITEENFSFTAQLIPIHRGILETIYVRLKSGVSAQQLLDSYAEAYDNEPFIRLYDTGVVPDVKAVQHTNFCDIGFTCEGRRAVIVSCIDNLIKGAAGQAVQNLNLMLGYDETEALL